jgi:glycosyltransferase involved in cell wall biosynthesis
VRIALVGPFGFHPNKTMRSRARPLAQALAGRGHTARLFMPPWQTPAEADKEWEEDGVSFRYTRLGGGYLAIAQRMAREVIGWQPDVVHSFKPKAYSGLVAWWLWRFRRQIRLVTDCDDWEGWGGWNDIAPYSPLQKRFFAWQERWGMAHCHALTVASRTLESLAWASGTRSRPVVYLPNGPGIRGDTANCEIERAALGLAERPTVLLYSRLFELNTARLVAALAQVRAAVPGLAILSVGAGLFQRDADELSQQVRAAGLADCFVETGWVEEARLPGLLAAADVGLFLMDDNLLNRTKCPVKLADMLFAGVPVVAEAVGQAAEYVLHERTGLLCPSGDADCLAAAVIGLLGDEGRRRWLGQGAAAHIRDHFAWDRLAAIAEQEAYQ